MGEIWRLGVHIADLASYIVADDRTRSRGPRKRGTAVYLGEHTIPLLPDAVHQACGFVPGAQRLAISVFLLLNDRGELIEFTIRAESDRIRLVAQSHPNQCRPRR